MQYSSLSDTFKHIQKFAVAVTAAALLLGGNVANADTVTWEFQGNEYSGTGDDLSGEVTVTLEDVEGTPGSVKITVDATALPATSTDSISFIYFNTVFDSDSEFITVTVQNDAGGSYKGAVNNEDGFSAGITIPDLDDGPLFDFRLSFNAPADGAPYFDQSNDIFEATLTLPGGLTVSDLLTLSAPNPIAPTLVHNILVGGSVAGQIEFSGTTPGTVLDLNLSIFDGFFTFDESHVNPGTTWDLTTGVLNGFRLSLSNPAIGDGVFALTYLDPASDGIQIVTGSETHGAVSSAYLAASIDCSNSGGTAADCTGVIPVLGGDQGPYVVSLRAVQLAPGAGGGYFAGGGNLNIPAGMPVNFTAIGTFDNGDIRNITEEVIWVSSDTSVGVFDTENPGQLHTLSSAVGMTTDVKAKTTNTENVEIETETVTVYLTSALLDRVVIQPETGVDVGETRQYTATAVFDSGDLVDFTDRVTWISSDTAVATVSNAAGTKGQITGVMTGTANITITDPASGEQDVLQIVVSQP